MRIGVLALWLVATGCLSKPDPPGQGTGDTYGALAVGARHACAIDDGALYCWGDNSSGQVGATVDLAVPSPTRVGDPSIKWTAVSAGAQATCGLHDGIVECWGDDSYGQVTGDIATTFAVPVPVQMSATPPAFEQVAAGGRHGCAVGAGQLWCWGSSALIGTAATAAIPLGGDGWTEISTGVDHSCGIEHGQVMCFGVNDNGQCGVPASSSEPVPVQVALPGQAIHAEAGFEQSCAIVGPPGATAGDLWCWGYNDDTTFATTPVPVLVPTRVGTRSDWTAITLSRDRACGIRGGEAVCWGNESVGGTGDGLWNNQVLFAAPFSLGPADAIELGAGTQIGDYADEVSCMIAGGAISCWGDEPHGELGRGTMTMHRTPVAIAPPAGQTWQHLWVGYSHTCAATASELDCWGDDTFGAVSGGPGSGRDLPCTTGMCDLATPTPAAMSAVPDEVVTGKQFTCALTSGHVSCWGDNTEGQLGAAAAGHGARPVPGSWSPPLSGGPRAACALSGPMQPSCWGLVVGYVTNMPGPVPAVPAGGLHFGDNFGCYINALNHRMCWGDNTRGQLGTGGFDVHDTTPIEVEMMTMMLAVDVSGLHGCEIDASHQVYCWGDNNAGEVGLAPSDPQPSVIWVTEPNDSCSALALGPTFSCALCQSGVLCWGDNSDGNLGRGTDTTTPAYTPAPVALPAGSYDEIGAGFTHACALIRGGSLYCWGYGPHGQLGDGSHASSQPVPLGPRKP